MKKNLLLYILNLVLIFTLKAQVNSTGAAEIGIPLYTFSEGLINVPIGLSYDATGIKPDNMAPALRRLCLRRCVRRVNCQH